MANKSGKSQSGQGGGPGGGSHEQDLEWYLFRVGVPLCLLFFLVVAVGAVFHKTPAQAWDTVTHPERAASSAWRAVQGTRCALGTCPKTQALDALDKLTVAPEANATTYRRGKFGPPWADVDHNRCDTRDDILRRDLTHAVTRKTSTCWLGAPVTGTFTDPYSGAAVTFNKALAIQVQIDHVYSLAAAWTHGGSGWDAVTRVKFANDPENLLATTAKVNRAKSDLTPEKWRPSGGPDAQCHFATIYVHVATKYSLSISVGDRAALAAMLAECAS